MARTGGRGCPRCGSHDTDALNRSGAQWCQSCDFRWIPCLRTCRGWRLDVRHSDGPRVLGCPECGVPNRVARTWPETHNALARELLAQFDKMQPTVDWDGSDDVSPVSSHRPDGNTATEKVTGASAE